MRWLLSVCAALLVCAGVVRGGDGFFEEWPEEIAAVAERFDALMQASDYEAAADLAYDPLETAEIRDSQTWRDLWAVFYDTRSHELIYDRHPDRREQMRRVRDRIFEMMLDSPDWNTVHSVGPAFVALSIGIRDTDRIHEALSRLSDRSAVRLERIVIEQGLPDFVVRRLGGPKEWVAHMIRVHREFATARISAHLQREYMIDIAMGDIAAMYGTYLSLGREADARIIANEAQMQHDDPLVVLSLLERTPPQQCPSWAREWIDQLDATIPTYEETTDREAWSMRARFEQVRRPLLEALAREDQPEPPASPSPAHSREGGEREER